MLVAMLDRMAAGRRPVVCLLAPISGREDYTPLPRTRLGWLRNRLRRWLDRALWAAGRTPAFHYSTYTDRRHTNRGDIAIRTASLHLLRAAFGEAAALIDIGWDELAPAAGWIEAHADLMLIGGGGYYFLDPSGRLDPRVARDLAVLRRLRCPLASLAPGVNCVIEAGADAMPAADPAARAVLAELLGRLRRSSTRDAAGRRLLDAIAPGRTVTLADPALFLPPRPPARPIPRAPAGTLAVGLNIAFHGPIQSRALPRRLRLFAALARGLAARRRCAFFYFVHADAERAIPPLLRLSGVPVGVVDGSAEDMLPRYAALDVHVCQMLHSSILAGNAGVPTLALGYDVKNAAFFELLGLERFCLNEATTDAAEAGARLEELLATREAVTRRLAARKAELGEGMADYLRGLVGLTESKDVLF